MWQIFRASAFYAIRAAIGKHEFAHLAHSKTTTNAGWSGVLLSSVLYLMCSTNASLPTALTTSIALAAVVGLATLKMNGPQQLSVIYTVAGVCLLCTPLQYSAAWFLHPQSGLPLHAPTIIWLGASLKKNMDRFQHLPADMQDNWYRPGSA
ncbi:MAG: hypothetical protein K2W33_02845 [Burkholderiales bacterium]|nr:hypothetical protein [Burkholderiales bacterium]